MGQTLNLLIIEDNQADFLLVERHLRQQGLQVFCFRVDNREDMVNALDTECWDLALTDYSIPRMDFHESFAYLQSRVPDLPVILVSGSVGEEQAVELLKRGIWDFVLKDNLTRLVPAIERCLKEFEIRKARLAAEESMRENEYRFRSIFNSSPIAIGIGRKDDGRLVEVNDAWLQLYGFERDEAIGRTTTELNLYVKDDDRNEIVRIISDCGQVINREIRIRRKSGETLVVLYSAELIELRGEAFLQVMMTDVTEQKRMETDLRKSEETYRSLFGNMLNGFAYCKMIFDGNTPIDFVYVSVNAAFEKQTGLKGVEGKRVTEIIPGIRESDPGLFEVYGRVARTGDPEQFEVYVKAMKEWFWVSVYCPLPDHFVAVFDVITGRKRNEAAREATVELLRICNMADKLPELMQNLMHYFQQITGCEAIGVRLRDGEDFPYYVTRGFSEEFVLAEKSLCSYDREGELIRDYAGHPAIDCMCGNILCRRFDPSKPFFTAHGSYWSSCTTEFLATTTDTDRQAKTRNRCIGEGYESMALIPLRYRDETYGLFQFNDREKGRFSSEKIALYEDLVDYVSITLSKLKSDEALRESEQFNLQIINNAEEGVVVYGTDLRYWKWNPYMERLSGLPAHDVIGKNPLELFPFLKEGGVIERLEKVLEGQPVSSTEFPFHSPFNGYTGWASDTCSPLKNVNGEIIGVIGMVRDITARKQSDETLRKLFVAVEQSPVMVMITDHNGIIEFVNPCFCKVTGYALEEARGKDLSIIRGDTSRELLNKLWDTISSGGTWEGDFHNRKKDGSLYWEHATISSIRNEAGEITHYMAIKEDITERRNLEEQLRQSQKMEAVGQLAGGVAHDFNNIMQVIIGNAQLQSIFNSQHGLDRRYVEEIFQAVERGVSLTRSLLVFSRKQPLEMTSFDLNGLIQESHKLALRLVTEDISINLELDNRVLTINGDAGLLQHVVFNLVTNARDAISRQGSIIINTRGIDIDGNFVAMHGGTSAEGRYALLSVKDNGCGISNEIKARIFEPFFTTKEAGKGTGLGLAMIYGTIRQMGGFIVVNSHPGSGTVFEIYIPLTDENVEAPVTSNNINNISGNGELLLIVEDEEGVRDLLAQILIISGYRVICAASGEEAIRLTKVNSSEIGLVIMDMILPGMNGMEIARELHNIRPELSVLFLSGYSDETLESKGINGYHLQKPVHPAQLLEHIHRMLNGLPST
jgi:PAS domain S-box-containing protein